MGMTRIRAAEPLQQHHQLGQFNCGESSLDEWLQQRAFKNEVLGASRTFVACVDMGDKAGGVNTVIAYYALAAGSVSHALLSNKIKRNMPNPLPVMVLGRLAVDNQWKGQGLGVSLLQDALLRCKAAAQYIGARAILVHALSDDAKHFYEHFGFRASPIDERTLMLLMSELD